MSPRQVGNGQNYRTGQISQNASASPLFSLVSCLSDTPNPSIGVSMRLAAAEEQSLTPVVLWAGTGACWAGQAFLPWTAHGALSNSSSIEAVELIRTGSVSGLVPAAALPLLLLLPSCGLLLAGLCGAAGRVPRILRALVAALGTLLSAALLLSLGGGGIPVLGPGGWLTMLGVVLAALSLLASRPHPESSQQLRRGRAA